MPIRKRNVAEAAQSGTAITTPMPIGVPGELIAGYGNLGNEDLIAARIKLLQGMSPETKPDGGSHRQGHWFHTSEGQTIGDAIDIVSLGERKTVEGWAPRDSRQQGEGILFRSSDGVNWDEGYANLSIDIDYIDGRRETWNTRANVAQSGFTQFKNGRPPIAGFTYRMALWLPEYPDYPVNLYIVTKTATQPLLDLHGRIRSRQLGGTPFYLQRYKMSSRVRKGNGVEWFVPAFENAGQISDSALANDLRIRSELIYRSNVVAEDEKEPQMSGGRNRGGDSY